MSKEAWGFLLDRVPVVQRPRTPPFHGDDTGSNPVGDANTFNNLATIAIDKRKNVEFTDVIIPDQFTAYQVENSLVSTALYQSGVVAQNGEIAAQLHAGAESFTVPFWSDLPDVEADITNDDPTILSTAQKISAGKQTVRKSFLHASWSEMSLASELQAIALWSASKAE